MGSPAQAFVHDALRTPRGRGRSDGSLHAVKPISLVAGLLDEVGKRNPGFDPPRVDDMILGVVSPVGDQGANLARTAALAAGYESSGAGFQLNRFCGSGPEAVNVAAQKVRSGWEDLFLAGGVESMSRVPMGADGGPAMTDPETAYRTSFVPQGISADLIATVEGFSCEDVDAFARSPGPGGQGCGGRPARPLARRRTRRQRPHRSGPGRTGTAGHRPGRARRAEAVVRGHR